VADGLPVPRRLILQDLTGTESWLLEAGEDYPGLPGVRKAVLHVHADPAIRFNLVEFAGGSQVPPHPSPTANYWFVLAGVIDSVVPGREPVTLQPGDCCVQLGVDHGWHVRGSQTASLLAVVVDL
jgi:quercetin dioxygenase-like cupin family protein